jgi:hypothetical protein
MLISFGAKTRQNVVIGKIRLALDGVIRRIKKTPVERSTGVLIELKEKRPL